LKRKWQWRKQYLNYELTVNKRRQSDKLYATLQVCSLLRALGNHSNSKHMGRTKI
jgi:hypothetical protein